MPADPRGIIVDFGADAVIPQFVDGGGWKTTLFLTNLDTKTVHYAVVFVGDSGTPRNFTLGGLTGEMMVGSLGVNQSVTLETPGQSGSLTQGWALVGTFDRPANQTGARATRDRLAGMAVFRLGVSGRPDAEAVVPISSVFDTNMHFPFDNRSGYSTAIAIVNPDLESSASVSFVFRSDSGTVLAQETVRIDPLAKLTVSTPDRFPGTRNQNGRLEVSTRGSLLSGLALRFNPGGSFTSVHALSVDAPVLPVTQPPVSGSLPGVTQSCPALRGADIVSANGTYLGRISEDKFATESIANEFGPYGSKFSATSIFNTVGTFGSDVSDQSPFNRVASQPPLIVISGQPRAYFTLNSSRNPRIDPLFVLQCVQRTR